MKRICLLLLSILLLIALSACGTAKDLLLQEKEPHTLPPSVSEVTGTAEDNSVSENKKLYSQGLEYANNEDWLNAYACYLAVDETELMKDTEYTEGGLDTAIAQCHSAIVSLGKTAYDSKDYITAYQYWSVCSVSDELDYSQEYSLCQLVENVQGRKFDRKNFDKTIFVDGTTVIVDSENEDIPKGEYTTYLGERTNNSGGKEWVLFFDNGNYVLKLPETADSLITLLDLTKAFPDNVKSYYSLAGAGKANEEGQKWAAYLKELERIKNSPPQIGMTKETVEMTAWGKPTRIHKTTYEWGVTEQWCYPQNRYVYFRNGVVVAISE